MNIRDEVKEWIDTHHLKAAEIRKKEDRIYYHKQIQEMKKNKENAMI